MSLPDQGDVFLHRRGALACVAAIRRVLEIPKRGCAYLLRGGAFFLSATPSNSPESRDKLPLKLKIAPLGFATFLLFKQAIRLIVSHGQRTEGMLLRCTANCNISFGIIERIWRSHVVYGSSV